MTRVLEDVGLNPAVHWMDVSNASYHIPKNNKNKDSQMGHTKKIILKKIETNFSSLLS
jgi:hypothetical protein